MIYRKELDGLRAIAVLAVILFHCGVESLSGGYIGVDVFFVISGYLVSQIIWRDLGNQSFTIGGFIKKRVLRLLPAALFMFGVTAIISAFIFLPLDFRKYGQSLFASVTGLANFYFAQDAGYFSESSMTKPLLHMWSLSVEEQFYIIMPLLLIGISRGKWKVIPVLSTLAIASLILSEWMVRNSPEYAYFLLPSRFWQLALGAILGISAHQVKSQTSQWLLASIGFIVILFSCFLYQEKTPFPGFSALLPTLATGFILCVPSHASVFKPMKLGLLREIGKSSYSSYLWHWPLVVFYDYAFGTERSVLAVSSLVLASLILGYLSYKYIETPFRYRCKQRSLRQVIAVTLIPVSLLSIVGISLHLFNGIPKRLASEVISYDSARDAVWKNRGHFHNVDPRVLNQEGGFRTLVPSTHLQNKVLVWGDSHASSLMPFIQEACSDEQVGMLAASMSAKLPFVTTYRDQYKQRDLLYSELFLKEVTSEKITDVILISSWSHYTHGELTEEMTHLSTNLHGNATEIEVFNQGFEDTYNALLAMNVRLWVLSEVPRHHTSVPSVKARALYLPLHEINGLISKEDHFKRVSDYENNMKTILKERYIDLSSHFFTQSGEPITEVNGAIIYYDSNHLNLSARELLIKPLKSLVKRIKSL